MGQSGGPSPAGSRRVVVTTVLGGYEELVEQPVARDSALEFVCLTDDPTLTSRTWTVQLVEPAFPLDLVRSARLLKIRPQDHLDDLHESLWIDNCVLLRRPPDALLECWLRDADLALVQHSFRTTVAEEFHAVDSLQLDDPARVYEQLIHYTQLDPEALEQPPLWTGMLARRHTPAVTAVMNRWADHVLRYSRRDQLSIVPVLRASGAHWTTVVMENQTSDHHLWPHHRRRLPGHHRRELRSPFVPAVAELTAATVRVRELEDELAAIPRPARRLAASGLGRRLRAVSRRTGLARGEPRR